MEHRLPEKLPATVQECEHLWQWRDLVKGLSQPEVAHAARCFQARISEIESGRVMPRRKYWPALMAAYRLDSDMAAEFYRMLLNAKREYQKTETVKRSLRVPLAETPLFDPTQNPELKCIGKKDPITPAMIEHDRQYAAFSRLRDDDDEAIGCDEMTRKAV